MDAPAPASSPPQESEAHRLHEEGLAMARQRRFDEAAGLFQETLKADPTRLDAGRHLAQAYTDGGRLAEAEAAWGQYLSLRPQDATGHRYFAALRRRMDKPEAAVESMEKAVALDDKSPALQVDLGVALAQAKRKPDAKRAFLRAVELDADYYDAYINLGLLLQEMKEGPEALKYLRRAIELRPDDPSGHNNLGVSLSEQGRFDEAVTCFENLLAKTPGYFLAWNNLGNALRAAGRLDDARAALEKALELKPDYTEACNNLGIIYTQMEDFPSAVRSFDQALLLRPDYPEAHANRGLIFLSLGNFQQGWADYEWRWQGLQGMKRRTYTGKMWDGSPLVGKRIMLHFEQGLGDTFQFIRYAKELKARGAHVIFECQPSTRQILDRTPGIDEFVIRGEKPPPFDFYAPLLSLPGVCQSNLDNLPRRVPYIFTDPAMIWDWKRRMAHLPGLKVGIVWQGNPDHKGDRYRSIPLKRFAPLASVPGVTLVTLQKNLGVEQIKQLDGLFALTDFTGVAEEGDGWLRTAAIIANLDLIICADTSVGHLAGAMGVPVWIAMSTAPDWRWLQEREDTPWYPTMRLFRQKHTGDWEELFGRIADAVRERLSTSGKPAGEPTSDMDQQEARALLRKAAEHITRHEVKQAQALLEQAARLDPANADVRQDLGVTYARQGRLRDAIVCFRRGLELAPDSAGLYGNLGLASYHSGQIEEAVSHLRKAVWLGAGSAETHKNLALALTALPDPAGAEECYWAALRLKPDDVDAHYHLARVLLMQGKFEQGWLEYEWRWRWRNTPKRHLDRPRWSGQKLEGKRLLILAEQDPRDTIQYARYAELIAQQGGRVVLECQPALVNVMRGCLGVDQVVPVGDPLPPHDLHTALLSLPATMHTTTQTLPAAHPYLGVDKGALELWSQRLGGASKIRIAIALEEDSAPATPGAPTSLRAKVIRRLAGVPKATLINFQPRGMNKAASEQNELPTVGTLSLAKDLGPLPDEPAERSVAIAAALRNVDLLIAVDNTIAHLAGAMGVPTWVLLPLSPDPRWLLNRDDTPWYPTMRLWRQRYRGDWDEVVNRMAQAVENNARLRTVD